MWCGAGPVWRSGESPLGPEPEVRVERAGDVAGAAIAATWLGTTEPPRGWGQTTWGQTTEPARTNTSPLMLTCSRTARKQAWPPTVRK
jgi:hypothetical protein